MASVEIRLDAQTEALEKAKNNLSEGKVNMALRMALNDAITRGRTLVRRSIQEVYNIKASRLNDADRRKGVTIEKATSRVLISKVNVGHKPISLAEFSPKYSGQSLATNVSFKSGKAKKGKSVKRSTGAISVEIEKGNRKTLATAFIPGVVNKSSGQITTPAIFARGKKGKPGFVFGKDRYPIDSMNSNSVATMALNSKALEKYEGPVNSIAGERFKYHVERLVKAAVE